MSRKEKEKALPFILMDSARGLFLEKLQTNGLVSGYCDVVASANRTDFRHLFPVLRPRHQIEPCTQWDALFLDWQFIMTENEND